MKTVELDDLRADPARLVHEIESGEDFVVVDHDRTIAEVHAAPAASKASRPHGLCAGQFRVPDDFDRPMMLVDDPEFADDYESPEDVQPGQYLEWEGNLLVYTGPVPSGMTDNSLVSHARDQRMRQVLYGSDE